MNITTHLLINNNINVVEDSLKSVAKLHGNILVGDLGSTDGTAAICRKLGAIVIPVLLADDYSDIRNKLLEKSKTEWNFHIEPWEILISGHDSIGEIVSNSASISYRTKLLRGNLITKEIRLANKKLKFYNPIFESMTDASACDINDAVIYSNNHAIDYTDQLKKINLWKKSYPAAYEPYYYHAFLLLEQKKYGDFIAMASHYLFRQKQGMSAVMVRYYLAMVYLYELHDAQSALKYILECIATRPLMAEFWCLLGDIYYKASEYKKAILFYENAKFLGARRLESDDWPLEISKYKQYPDKMIASCINITDQSRTMVATNQ